jgi:NDP-sugar pyrophosphorylase family protein
VRAAILAAGWGERLREGGVETPKPLVRVAGRTLLHHALGAVREAGADRALVVVNEGFADAVADALDALPPPLPVELVRRTTASSLETFAVASAHLVDEPRALVAMVDGIFPSGAARAFGQAARGLSECEPALEGLIGVTDRRDDDRPLRVAFDAARRISAIGRGAEGSSWSTAGLYLLPGRAFAAAGEALEEGLGALRAYLERLVEMGVALRAHPLGAVVDVDRPDDLQEAERAGKGA